MQEMQRRVSSKRQSIQIKQSTQEPNRESLVFKQRRKESQTRIGSFDWKIL